MYLDFLGNLNVVNIVAHSFYLKSGNAVFVVEISKTHMDLFRYLLKMLVFKTFVQTFYSSYDPNTVLSNAHVQYAYEVMH